MMLICVYGFFYHLSAVGSEHKITVIAVMLTDWLGLAARSGRATEYIGRSILVLDA